MIDPPRNIARDVKNYYLPSVSTKALFKKIIITYLRRGEGQCNLPGSGSVEVRSPRMYLVFQENADKRVGGFKGDSGMLCF